VLEKFYQPMRVLKFTQQPQTNRCHLHNLRRWMVEKISRVQVEFGRPKKCQDRRFVAHRKQRSEAFEEPHPRIGWKSAGDPARNYTCLRVGLALNLFARFGCMVGHKPPQRRIEPRSPQTPSLPNNSQDRPGIEILSTHFRRMLGIGRGEVNFANLLICRKRARFHHTNR